MGKSEQIEPIEQWLCVKHKVLRVKPWCVVVSGYVRAQFELEADARHLVDTLTSQWKRYVSQPAAPMKGTAGGSGNAG